MLLLNGRAYCVYNSKDPVWWALGPQQRMRAHAFVAAHSVADAVRLIEEYNGGWPKARYELNKYWSQGTWGTRMEGITPERGIWIAVDHDKPIRLNTMEPKQLEIPMEAKPRTRVRLPIDPLDTIPRTPWVRNEDPPLSGLWDVCDCLSDSGQEARWWFDKEKGEWITDTKMKIPADIFRGTHGWRGLQFPPNNIVYPTPPYDGRALAEQAVRSNVVLRTTYLTMWPAKRPRVHL